jgi:hypothetical protein
MGGMGVVLLFYEPGRSAGLFVSFTVILYPKRDSFNYFFEKIDVRDRQEYTYLNVQDARTPLINKAFSDIIYPVQYLPKHHTLNDGTADPIGDTLDRGLKDKNSKERGATDHGTEKESHRRSEGNCEEGFRQGNCRKD